MNRREFFKRGLKASFIYPPYYKDKRDFVKCNECESKDCLIACNEKVIKIIENKPTLNFNNSGCTFCDECAINCKYGVLRVEYKKDKIAQMIINPNKCIAWNKTICFSCYDICEENAIIYKGMLNPVIDLDKCTGCGFCISVCVANSIEIKGIE